jgi:rhamnulokinase
MSGHRLTVAAVDLGASSGRVLAGRYGPDGMSLREVYRFANEPVRVTSVLRWDVLALFRGVLAGLRLAKEVAGPIDSVGVDGWGVDYGLLDADGQLLGNPAHYRDGRTATAMAEVVSAVGSAALYAATGTQLQPFNTLFQLYADRGSPQLASAEHALLIPDLMTYWLCGALGTELTNASTTGLLDPRTMRWSDSLAGRLKVPVGLFPPLRRPGQLAGTMLPDPTHDAGLGVAPQVVAVASHDTASAVAGVPASSANYAYVSTGTWALVGVDLPAPVITEDARTANFTNEVGIDGSVRFLRNVTGFWLLQECVREWRTGGSPVDLDELTRAAEAIAGHRAIIDVQEPAFAAPGAMVSRVVQACRRTSGVTPSSPAEITRCILDSLAVAIRHAVKDAARLTESIVDVVHVVGGGALNAPFCQAVADACRLPVVAGPAEATAWGNAICQLRAHGTAIGGLAEARSLIRRAEPPTRYAVRGDEKAWQLADELVLQAREVQL